VSHIAFAGHWRNDGRRNHPPRHPDDSAAGWAIPDEQSGPYRIVKHIRAVLDINKTQFGEKTTEALDALVHYWGTVSDLIQRQEHGSQAAGRPLVWEDARRVVFQTAIVMFEIDNAVSL